MIKSNDKKKLYLIQDDNKLYKTIVIAKPICYIIGWLYAYLYLLKTNRNYIVIDNNLE